MAFTDDINRSDAAATIPEDAARDIIKEIPSSNPFFGLVGDPLPMSARQKRLPVASVLPVARFLDGDSDLIHTSEARWKDVYIEARVLALEIPIPIDVLEDSEYDLWGELRPVIVEAVGSAIVAAIVFGTNAPAGWPDDLLTQITNAGHLVSKSNFPDWYSALFEVGGALNLIEEDGYMATGHLAHPSMKARLRGMRDADGMPMFSGLPAAVGQYQLDGERLSFAKDGSFTPASARMISGDFSHLKYAIRKDITYRMRTDGVIQDAGGNIVINLGQQRMHSLQMWMRCGWAVPNPINRQNSNDSTRFAFAAVKD